MRLLYRLAASSAREVVGFLGGPIIGMTEQRLRNPDVLRVMDREFRGNGFSEEMGVERLTKLALGYPADQLSDALGSEGFPTVAVQNASPATGMLDRCTNSSR
jgi:hypothetical protein